MVTYRSRATGRKSAATSDDRTRTTFAGTEQAQVQITAELTADVRLELLDKLLGITIAKQRALEALGLSAYSWANLTKVPRPWEGRLCGDVHALRRTAYSGAAECQCPPSGSHPVATASWPRGRH